ncbi:MAG: PLDc N-terminal domain-containing protein [Balneolaceae bacterium]
MEGFGIGLVALTIIALALWFFAIADIVKGSLAGDTNRILWLLIVIFFPILGALLYLFIGKKPHRS